MKTLARKQLESRKAHAVRTTRKYVPDRNRGNEAEGDTLTGDAEYRRIKIRYPKGVNPVAIPTRRDLLDRIKELENENEDLQTQIDEIADIVTPSEEEENEGE